MFASPSVRTRAKARIPSYGVEWSAESRGGAGEEEVAIPARVRALIEV